MDGVSWWAWLILLVVLLAGAALFASAVNGILRLVQGFVSQLRRQ
jgi:hypothetical protein